MVVALRPALALANVHPAALIADQAAALDAPAVVGPLFTHAPPPGRNRFGRTRDLPPYLSRHRTADHPKSEFSLSTTALNPRGTHPFNWLPSRRSNFQVGEVAQLRWHLSTQLVVTEAQRF